MTTTTNLKFCCACGKYKAYRDGMCWGCHAEYRRHESDFAVAAKQVVKFRVAKALKDAVA